MSIELDLSDIVLRVAVEGKLDEQTRALFPISPLREIPPRPGTFAGERFIFDVEHLFEKDDLLDSMSAFLNYLKTNHELIVVADFALISNQESNNRSFCCSTRIMDDMLKLCDKLEFSVYVSDD